MNATSADRRGCGGPISQRSLRPADCRGEKSPGKEYLACHAGRHQRRWATESWCAAVSSEAVICRSPLQALPRKSAASRCWCWASVTVLALGGPRCSLPCWPACGRPVALRLRRLLLKGDHPSFKLFKVEKKSFKVFWPMEQRPQSFA